MRTVFLETLETRLDNTRNNITDMQARYRNQGYSLIMLVVPFSEMLSGLLYNAIPQEKSE